MRVDDVLKRGAVGIVAIERLIERQSTTLRCSLRGGGFLNEVRELPPGDGLQVGAGVRTAIRAVGLPREPPMGENLLPGIVSVEEGATALDGEEGGDFGFGGFELPGGELAVRKVREVA